MAGINQDVIYGANVDFTGGFPVAGQMVQNGQLLIGAVSAPFIRSNTLTAGSNITITNGPGTITISSAGGGGGGGANSLMGNSGSAPAVAGVINVFGSNGITTSGDSVQTLTISPSGNLLALQNLSGTGYVVQTGANTFVERTFVAGSGITLTNPDGVAGATTITAGATVPTTFTEDSGTATPSGNNLNILGTSAQGISTSGSGATVTITASNATATQKGVASFNATNFTVTAGAVASNAITVTAGTGLTTGGSVNLGGSVTLALDVPVTVAHGGTGDTSLTAHGVLIGEGTSAVNVTTAGTNGQVLIGSAGADPAFATVGGTQGVTLTTGANTLSIGLVAVPNSALANSSITISAGSGISVSGSPVSLGGTVTISAAATNANQFSTDSGVAIPSGNNLNILGTAAQGISTSGSGSTVTLTVANATTTTKGVASFNSANFTVSSGAVSLITTGIVETLTPNSGGAVSASSSNINDKGLAANSGGNAFPLFSYNGGAGVLNWENRTYLTPYVVDASTTNGSKGTFTTIALALSQASTDSYQGDIFIRAGTYTENVTLIAGVNLVAFTTDAFTPSVTIAGKLSFSSAGTVSLSGLNLQTNSDNVLAVTGSAASIVNLNNCNLNLTNNTGITFSSSNSSAAINITNCTCDTGTTGIAYFSDSSSGTLSIIQSEFLNSGASTTANTKSAGQVAIKYSTFRLPITYSSSNTSTTFNNCTFNTASTNSTCLTTSGTGTVSMIYCITNSGTASAISIGSGTAVTLHEHKISSTNANVITGAGTLHYTPISFFNNSTINPTTQDLRDYGPRIQLSGGCQLISGSGSPSGSVSAPQGSLYLRTDGTTINNRMYVNTNGSTGWSAVTTVS